MKEHKLYEQIALDIAHDLFPLEMCLELREKKQQRYKLEQQFEKEVVQFSRESLLSLPLALEVLEGTFLLSSYRQQKYNKIERDKQARKISLQENIPLNISRLIVDGKTTLEQYRQEQQKKDQRKQQAEALKKEHADLAIETCYQIIDKGITVKEYLEEREANRERRSNWYRKYLEDNLEDNKPLSQYLTKMKRKKIPLALYRFGLNSACGKVVKENPYEITLSFRKGQKTFPKVNLKFFCRQDYLPTMYQKIEIDRQMQQKAFENRPDINNTDFLQGVAPGDRIEVVLAEGEKFRGKVNWFTKYDLKIEISSAPRTSVTIFRHAIVSASKL